MLGTTAIPAIYLLFQSAPGLEAGRCLSQMRKSMIFCEFQSAPGLEAGRCSASATDYFESGITLACANQDE